MTDADILSLARKFTQYEADELRNCAHNRLIAEWAFAYTIAKPTNPW